MACLTTLAWSAQPSHLVCAQSPKPNIIYILADDLGYGSVGFNGQTQIQTPNLDALAAGGMRLTNSYSCPTCAASRASLLTGFHQGHSSVDGNDELDTGFRAVDIMTPQVLAPAGYQSAIFGKWGFGADGVRNLNGADPLPNITAPNSLPNNHGFTDFYGYLNHGAAHDYFYSYMWQTQAGAPNGVTTVPNNGGPGGTPQYSHDLIAAKSEQYIAAHASDANPFYMQVSYTIPHWDIDSIVNAPGGYGIYASKPGWTTQQKAYAAMITRMDASIGSLLNKLKDPNGDGNQADSILNNTLIIFSSDNGPTGEDASPVDFFNANGQFRGGKFEAYEGGIHMPTVAYWPGKIAAGSSSGYRTDMADFMATAADLAGVETPVGIDGTSIMPTLTGVGQQRARDYIIIEQQGSRPANLPDPDPRVTRWAVITQAGMKLIRYDDESSVLFNLNTDPGETSPLSLSVPANAAIATQLEGYAIAEGVTRGVVEYRTWTGPNGGNVQDRTSWDGNSHPMNQWSAVLANTTASPRIAHVGEDVTTLGFEVRGATATQVVDIHPGRTLKGQNEVRISNHGRVDLEDGTLATNRWVNVRAGGEIRGKGTIVGDVYNQGVVSPGRPNDATSWPTITPAALPASSYNSGEGNILTFDFTGTQDAVPLFATSTKNQYLEVTDGLDWGPGTGPRWSSGGSNAGDEFNHIGHATATLAQAIDADNYISFTIDPTNGAAVIPSSVSFRLWRNGPAAAQNFAILSSIGGFTAGAALSPQLSISDTGNGNQHTLTATIPAAEAISGPVEFRLYGWGASVNTGNTHVNLVSLNGRVVGAPTLEFNFNGVQDGAPLTALKRTDSNMTLTSGLSFGPGVSPSGTNNAGSEFNIAGFSTSPTQQSALDGDDYVSFSVQAITGMAMIPDSASFTLWRQSATSATDYAVFSSASGFNAGQQLAQSHFTTVGSGNQLTITGSFISPQPTTDSLEIRLYGYGAGSAVDSTHLVAASMRARFMSIVGTPIDPTGSIAVEGDFYHQAGGQIAIDLGGHSAGVDYDTINVDGKADLAGNLSVALADVSGTLFAPAAGDIFQILTATQGITGQFASVALPTLAFDLNWQVNYLANAVTLSVIITGDFNHDGFVDSADYVVWRKNNGSQEAYNAWRANFGAVLGSGTGLNTGSPQSDNVPEPAGFALLVLGSLLCECFTRRRSP